MSPPANDAGVVQRRASNPLASAWVSANAGSGKTFVLAQRVVRLLLAGTDPASILCLTFTKAAAAEMAKRVFEDLAKWTRLDDAALSLAIEAIEGAVPGAAMLSRARRLFALALETPGGLKIQTIHAFCEQLLHRFPFEANVAGHFEVLDDRLASALIARAQDQVLARAGAEPKGRLGLALRRVSEVASDTELMSGIGEFVARRDRIRAWMLPHAGFESALASLGDYFSLAADESSQGIRRKVLGEIRISAEEMRQLVERLSLSGPNDRKAAAKLLTILEGIDEAAAIAAYEEFLLTDKGEPRKGAVTTGVLAAFPGLGERLQREQARLEMLRQRELALDCVETSQAMLILADAVIGAYNAEKARRGVLDFEDLVVKTANLLTRQSARDWVQFKLDRGLDHILVDEAQDTSPRQWEVIAALTEEFFAGAGARPAQRTIFAVGDEKQSIYSFQGAAPAWFALMRDRIAGRAKDAQMLFENVTLHLSYRASPDLLLAIDAVFQNPAAHKGLSQDGPPPNHTAHRRTAPGDVMLWPMFETEKGEPPEDWAAPLDRLGEASPQERLAQKIARTIRAWLDGAQCLPGSARPIRPGNILILTRKRGVLHAAINRALKRADIDVAGADRLALLDDIAVLDLLALGEVMLLPEDDLSLAALLKSPLFGMDEETLFHLAHGRRGTLWQALAKADPKSRVGEIFATLQTWRGRADYLTPFDFYARILAGERGRRAFARRLGNEAEDALDEFLAEALAYERAEPPSLQGFIAWMKDAAGDIKRDPSAPRDEVRVMTIHGAKGLEAEIVFLVDDGSPISHSSHDPSLVELVEGAGPLFWFRGKTHAPKVLADRIQALRERAGEEYRRLLYVALSRAKDRLVVCGIGGGRTEADGWYGLIRSALEPGSFRVEAEGDEQGALRWPIGLAIGGETKAAASAAKEDKAQSPLPDWLSRPPPRAIVEPNLSPSRVFGDLEFSTDAGGSAQPFPLSLDELGLARGRLLHRLLQALPELKLEERAAAAERYLNALASAWPEGERIRAAREVLAVLSEERFAEAFAPGSRAEIPIAGKLLLGSRQFAVRGRIDRLAVTPSRILIIDYKTNRILPVSDAEIPPQYLRQMALYSEILRRIYPGREIAAALLWTSQAQLMEIPAELLLANMADLE